MPELPEVETIRRDLLDKVLDKQVVDLLVQKDSALDSDKKPFVNFLENKQFGNIDRQGKLLSFDIKDHNKHILTHLRMTGKLIFDKEGSGMEDFPSKHTGVIFTFEDGSKLYFDDIRTFGYMQLVDSEEKEDILEEKLGIEPLTDNFTLENFKEVLKNRKTNIKSILLKQRAIAGIGNIYADEICHASGVRPDKKIPKLEEKEIKKLYQSCEDILEKAIFNRGTTFRNYVDSQGEGGNFASKLKVYGRENEDCYGCNNSITKVKLSGRGTHFCETCQK